MDGEQILIVDDESSIREVLSSLLAEEGFRPLAAGTAEEGLERLAGADDSLIKPFEELDLVTAAVSRAIDHANLVREKEALTEALARGNGELLEANRNLVDQANRDGLTGLYNHRYFQDALRNFKKYNGREGHQAGDKVISTIGEMLRGCVRGCDVPARYGGADARMYEAKKAGGNSCRADG